ncbi:hypothetical protein DB44_CW00600 [Candidatus Protochlamydia amoebophila]|uniref:Uncharacterized protein n=1 Tax=Candidatus Protochlamydia amoebophila TaxID=362787 RepID=A0A0C1JXB4_9BACT|nr:hypothetical protein DB44_CW00600 [Candidatus Protochlamydia amoebophila]
MVADSQSVKTTEKGISKASMAERKLKLESGIYWLIMKANRAFVTAANLEDREGLQGLLDNWKNSKRKMKIIWVVGKCTGDDVKISLAVFESRQTHR